MTTSRREIARCKMVVVCVPPSNLSHVVYTLSKHINPLSTMIVSILVGVTVQRLQNVFNTKNILRPYIDLPSMPIKWSEAAKLKVGQ